MNLIQTLYLEYGPVQNRHVHVSADKELYASEPLHGNY